MHPQQTWNASSSSSSSHTTQGGAVSPIPWDLLWTEEEWPTTLSHTGVAVGAPELFLGGLQDTETWSEQVSPEGKQKRTRRWSQVEEEEEEVKRVDAVPAVVGRRCSSPVLPVPSRVGGSSARKKNWTLLHLLERIRGAGDRVGLPWVRWQVEEEEATFSPVGTLWDMMEDMEEQLFW